jgi:hypothetical protein
MPKKRILSTSADRDDLLHLIVHIRAGERKSCSLGFVLFLVVVVEKAVEVLYFPAASPTPRVFVTRATAPISFDRLGKTITDFFQQSDDDIVLFDKFIYITKPGPISSTVARTWFLTVGTPSLWTMRLLRRLKIAGILSVIVAGAGAVIAFLSEIPRFSSTSPLGIISAHRLNSFRFSKTGTVYQ